MRVRWGEEAFHPDGRVDGLGKALKLSLVHELTDEFMETPA